MRDLQKSESVKFNLCLGCQERIDEKGGENSSTLQLVLISVFNVCCFLSFVHVSYVILQESYDTQGFYMLPHTVWV